MEKTGCNLTRNTSRTAQEVLDKIAHAMAQRRADETREELEQILKRIEIINANYELTYRSKPDMFQCIADLTELEELLKDQFMRKKFQDKVTIFVVGCHANIAENFILLQQVNDFFATSSTNFDDDFESFETDDLDMGAMSSAMKETLKTTETLINRLGEINLDLVQCLEQLEQKKTAKGRKKLEVALQQTKDDVTKLNQTLHCLQHGMQEKEEKIHQLDLKNKELMKLNSSAVSEAIKRNSVEVEVLKSVISNRDRQISQLEGDVRHLEKELASILAKFPPQLRQHPSLWIEPAVEIVPSSTSPSSSPSNILQRMHQLPDGDSTTKASDESTDSNEDPENMASYGGRTDSPDCNESQMIMEDFTSTESLDVRKIIREQNGATEIVIQKESKEDLASRYHPSFVKDAAKLTVGAQVALSHGVTRRSSDAKTSNKSRHISRAPRKTSNSKQDFASSHSTSGQSLDSSLSVPGIGLSDARKSLSALQEEETQQLNESLDLKDEETWSGYPSEEISLRFKQYRTLALNRISELEDELDVTIRKTSIKVDSLKQQFQDQHRKWEAKEKALVDGLRQMHVLQSEADQDIVLALTHLEDTVNMHDNQEKDNNSVRRDDLWPVMEDLLAQDAGDSEINLKEDETGFVEPDQLEKMTDDAKVQMSRESTKISCEATKDPLVTELSITDELQLTEDEQILYDMKPSATISSEMVDESTSPLNLTWGKVDMDECRETLLAIRQRMEERLMKTNSFVISSDFTRASPHDELDVDNEGQVVEGHREEGQQKVMHSQGTSPAEFINELSNDTLQSLQTSCPVTVLEDYLKTYDDICTFQQNLANYLPINTSSVDRITFNRAGPIKSQVVLLSQSINKILGEIMNYVASLANSIKQPTSSNVIDQRNSQHPINNKRIEVGGRLEMENAVSPAKDKEETELRTEYMRLANALEQEKRLHRDQFHFNSALVSEMQDTISGLKRELSTLRVKANGITQHHLQPPPSPLGHGDPIIFTRLDSERNVKIMRKAIVEQRISVDRCKAVLHRMKRYVDLPGQRLQHLAHTYAQHRNLLETQESLRSGDGILDSDLLGLLTKMELYQRKRLEKCDEKSHTLSEERAHLAKELVEILSKIELESGIFLIKPVYSYKGSSDPDLSSQWKRTRPNQPNQSVKRQQLRPHTPPVYMTTDGSVKQPMTISCSAMSVKSSDQLENGLQGKAKQLIGEPTRPVWKQSESTADQMADSRSSQPSIPHLYELDVNRVMIGNNNISVKLHPNSSSALGTSSGTRSYVATSRPNGSATIPHRSASITGLNAVPPSTPALYGSRTEAEGARLFNSSSQMSQSPSGPSLITTPPLPPIPSSKADEVNVPSTVASITQQADEEDPANSTD